jgi:large subunit ribosomal protein L4
MRGALSDRARAGRVHVVTALVDGDTPSTKAALAAVRTVTEAAAVLVVVQRGDDLSWKSLRNVPEIHLLAPDQLNTYDVLINDDVVFTQAALDAFLAGPRSGASAKATATSTEAEAADETEEESA